MSNINLTGENLKGYENVVVPEDAYVAKLKEVDEAVAQVNSKFGNKERILLRWEIETAAGAKVIPQFLNPNVSKGSAGYSSTNSYDLIDKSGNLQKFAQMVGNRQDIPTLETINFLKFGLVGRKAKIVTKTRTRGDGTQYSAVREVLAFV